MRKILILWLLFLLIFPNINLAAEQKPLNEEEVLKLRNYELSLQNLRLQIELLDREIQKYQDDRDTYINGLYKKYGIGKEWKIDLQKGIWFIEDASQGAKGQGGKKSD
jgi:hypothetical protein